MVACSLWALACVIGMITLALSIPYATTIPALIMLLGLIVALAAAIRGDSFEGLNRL